MKAVAYLFAIYTVTLSLSLIAAGYVCGFILCPFIAAFDKGREHHLVAFKYLGTFLK